MQQIKLNIMLNLSKKKNQKSALTKKIYINNQKTNKHLTLKNKQLYESIYSNKFNVLDQRKMLKNNSF